MGNIREFLRLPIMMLAAAFEAAAQKKRYLNPATRRELNIIMAASIAYVIVWCALVFGVACAFWWVWGRLW